LREFQDGTYSMEDLADMLEALSVKSLMEERAHKAQSKN
jgi:hypothetical protein